MSKRFVLIFLTLWPFVGGILSFIIGKFNKYFRDYFADIICLIELAIISSCYELIGAEISLNKICGLGLNFKLDGFRFIYCVIISFMWSMTTIFSHEYLEHHRNRNRYYLYVLFTFGSIIGVFLSADLFTTFIFFEMMSLFSYVMVAQDETHEAEFAAQSYLTIAIIGGLATLTGLIFLYAQAGTLEIEKLKLIDVPNKINLYISGVLIFSGFAAKAAIFPAHIWLPTAHTAAPAPSSALLSGLLTKSGLFGILVLSSGIFLHDKKWGLFLLILALITMILGAVLAVFSVNIKRTLACSSMSQLGFILIGISMQCFLGRENDLAVRGTILYMVGHSLIKLILFLCAGVVHMNTHKLNLNDIRGFGRGKKVFLFAFVIGGLGLMGFPFLNGYLGKTLIHESIIEYINELAEGTASFKFMSAGIERFIFQVIEWLFLISGGLTVSYVLKLFVILFIAEPSKEMHIKNKYISFGNALILIISALILPIIGFFPYAVADKIAFISNNFMNGPEHHHFVEYFSAENIEGAVISLIIGTSIYFFTIKDYLMTRNNYECLDLWPVNWNLETKIFRPLLGSVLPFIGALIARLTDFITAEPVSWILSGASKIKFINPPEDLDFGYYQEESKDETAGILLPSSLAYGLMTFAIGLLFVIGYMML